MPDAEIAEILRELMSAAQAQGVRLAPEKQELPPNTIATKLGAGAMLSATFASEERPDAVPSRREQLERSARALRDVFRRRGCTQWPSVSFPSGTPNQQRLILARMQQFLQGLVNSSNLYQMVLMRRGQIIASAETIEPLDESRLEFLARQLERAATQSADSSHGELVHGDVYAISFWHGAALFGFAGQEYSIDFVRHRTRLVAKELTHLLIMLDDDPNKPVKTAPIPQL